jgi:hypothetical protein
MQDSKARCMPVEHGGRPACQQGVTLSPQGKWGCTTAHLWWWCVLRPLLRAERNHARGVPPARVLLRLLAAPAEELERREALDAVLPAEGFLLVAVHRSQLDLAIELPAGMVST